MIALFTTQLAVTGNNQNSLIREAGEKQRRSRDMNNNQRSIRREAGEEQRYNYSRTYDYYPKTGRRDQNNNQRSIRMEGDEQRRSKGLEEAEKEKDNRNTKKV